MYARAGTSLWKHARIESALDERLKAFPLDEKHATLWRKRLTLEEEATLFTAYSAIAVKCGFPTLEKPAFLRAIERFHTYPTLSSILPFSQKYTFATEEVQSMLTQAVDTSGELFSALLTSIKKQTPPPKDLFGKNYLTGI